MKKKYIWGIVGSLILAVVGSALWDLIRPLTHKIYEFILNVSTLGVEKFKDDLYQEIARGFHESVSLEMYFLINLLFLGMAIGMTITISVYAFARNGNHKFVELIKSISIINPEKLSTRGVLILLFVYLIILPVVFGLDLAKSKYINDAVAHYEQLKSIATPFLEQKEIQNFDSEFSQIQNRDDYARIINALTNVVSQNELRAPSFEFVF